MSEVIDIVSIETGEIFAENLAGLGSARRWIASRGLTEDSLETDEEVAAKNASVAEEIARYEAAKVTHPQEMEGIERELARYRAIQPCRSLYVKEGWCPRVSYWDTYPPSSTTAFAEGC